MWWRDVLNCCWGYWQPHSGKFVCFLTKCEQQVTGFSCAWLLGELDSPGGSKQDKPTLKVSFPPQTAENTAQYQHPLTWHSHYHHTEHYVKRRSYSRRWGCKDMCRCDDTLQGQILVHLSLFNPNQRRTESIRILWITWWVFQRSFKLVLYSASKPNL
jgi:hypothetical protein